jgi:hypothetical protein
LLRLARQRDSAAARAALGDPSRTVRAAALKVAASVCSDDDLVSALRSATPRTQKWLLWALRRNGRQSPIDAFASSLN